MGLYFLARAAGFTAAPTLGTPPPASPEHFSAQAVVQPDVFIRYAFEGNGYRIIELAAKQNRRTVSYHAEFQVPERASDPKVADQISWALFPMLVRDFKNAWIPENPIHIGIHSVEVLPTTDPLNAKEMRLISFEDLYVGRFAIPKLFINAVQAIAARYKTPHHTAYEGRLVVDIRQRENDLEIISRDNGDGISFDTLNRLFHKPFSTKINEHFTFGGAGEGMYDLLRHGVEALNGFVEIFTWNGEDETGHHLQLNASHYEQNGKRFKPKPVISPWKGDRGTTFRITIPTTYQYVPGFDHWFIKIKKMLLEGKWYEFDELALGPPGPLFQQSIAALLFPFQDGFSGEILPFEYYHIATVLLEAGRRHGGIPDSWRAFFNEFLQHRLERAGVSAEAVSGLIQKILVLPSPSHSPYLNQLSA